MAATTSYQVAPPEAFNFSRPQEWPKWLRRFERFRSVAGLSDKAEEVQVNTLIYTMGPDADDILRSFKLSAEDEKKYDTVKDKFESHFVKRRNVIFERAKFNSRRQEEGEPVDTFITDLYALAEHCQYGALHDELIRDRLVVGLHDAALSEKLQLDAKLTLDKAVTTVRQSEAIKSQQSTVRGDTEKDNTPIGAIQNSKPPPWKRQQKGKSGYTNPKHPCQWCGQLHPYDRSQCPARESTCRKCNKKGHFHTVCRSSSNVHEVVETEGGVDYAFLGNVQGTNGDPDDPWKVTIDLNGTPTKFYIDTGAEVTVISEAAHRELKCSPSLTSTKRVLKGPSQKALPVRGQFTGFFQLGDQEIRQEIYVVVDLQRPLLGRPAIEALGLLKRIRSIEQNRDDRAPGDRFPQLFTGLGRMEGEYTIKLKEGATPFSISTPRRVPIPLMQSVKAELDSMQKLGVISPIQKPTEWCSGMVVVPKSNGKVRICVDLTKLNENVCRELHPIPAVEQILARISGAKVFSKLDCNSGFWQIPLDEDSAPLTTFITPFGRYQFNRLPFGITSAPEHFQRRMSALLSGLEGYECLIDDILVHGRTQKEHDDRLNAVLGRLLASGLTLNQEKCLFSVPWVKFLGQILTQVGVESDPDKVAAIHQMELKNISDVRRFLGMANHRWYRLRNRDRKRPCAQCWHSLLRL